MDVNDPAQTSAWVRANRVSIQLDISGYPPANFVLKGTNPGKTVVYRVFCIKVRIYFAYIWYKNAQKQEIIRPQDQPSQVLRHRQAQQYNHSRRL
jgi:hypothetical protein